MIEQLTRSERQSAIVLLLAVFCAGLVLLVIGKDDLLGAHGLLVMAAATLGVFGVISGFFAPEPSDDRFDRYYDEPAKIAILLAMVWAAVGMFVGDWVAWLLAYPDLTFDGVGWASFGRLRPVHTSGVIFGFGGNALIGTSFYVMQRTSRARIPDPVATLFVVFGYNLFCVLAASGYLMGITQSKEYAEPEWYADLLLTVVWVTYLVVYMRTLAYRKEPHIYVANWYYMGFILVVAMLHIVNNLAVPVWGSTKSYSAFSGVQDAMTQWWYGHNAVAFFLTAGFLGMLYYFMPKRAGRPLYSYRMSIISFWGITFLYMWAGSHHLHFTALPQWVQTLGMTFSVILLVPSWTAAANGLLTLNGAWHKVRDDATPRFMMVAAVFYGLTTFEGSFMAIRSVNALSHYTDWTIGHVHAGALGWVAMITFGSIYAIVPWLWKRPAMYSNRLIEVHFWLALAGTVVYVISMWNSGIIQGLMWRTYNANGTLAYTFVDSLVAMHPYYIARAVGGLLFLLGALVGCYNVWMTVRGAPRPEAADIADVPQPGPVLKPAE